MAGEHNNPGPPSGGKHGPKTPMGGVKSFSCRGCGGQVKLLAPGQSLTAACTHCGAVADLTDENFQVLHRYKQRMHRDFPISIGDKATFDGKLWQVVGIMQREVKEFEFTWVEYLLFNPYHGFRFLFSGMGHWSWIQMVNDLPIKYYEGSGAWYKGRRFKEITSGQARVKYVIGEFYWQVKVGDIAFTRDLIAPPYMLSCELEDGGMIWSLGTYLEPREVAEAFGIEKGILPEKVGVGANQPNPAKRHLRLILPAWIIAMVVMLGMTAWNFQKAPKTVVFSAQYPYPLAEDTVAGPFDVPLDMQNLEVQVDVQSGLDNNWVEITGMLHNVATNVNYNFILPAEYYHGVSDGESWSEGSRYADITINDIPGGKYELITSSAADTNGLLTLTVVRGVPIATNAIGLIILISILPIILIIRSASFEKIRKES
jgi:hypothetical protein